MSYESDLPSQGAIRPPSQARGFTGGQSNAAGTNTRPPELPAIANTRMSTSSFIASGTVKQILAASPKRSYLLIQNNGLNTLFVGFGSTPNLSGSNALQLPANTGITFEHGIVPNNDVYIVATSETLVTVIEGVRT